MRYLSADEHFTDDFVKHPLWLNTKCEHGLGHLLNLKKIQDFKCHIIMCGQHA